MVSKVPGTYFRDWGTWFREYGYTVSVFRRYGYTVSDFLTTLSTLPYTILLDYSL